MSAGAATRPKRRADIRAETIEGEMVLHDPVQGQAVYLNQTAALIWQLCDGTRSPGEMIALLEREVGGDDADVAGDVRSTLDRLAAAQLLGPPD